jgi:hypothetical protein
MEWEKMKSYKNVSINRHLISFIGNAQWYMNLFLLGLDAHLL